MMRSLILMCIRMAKGTKQGLIAFLTRYKGDGFAEYLQEKINKLPDSIEYVLFAVESGG